MPAVKSAIFAVAMIGALWLVTPAKADCDANQPSRTPIDRYAINGGTVYDTKSDLTWSRCSVGQHWQDGGGCVGVVQQLTWDDAMPLAADGWRVPTLDEIATLIAPTCKNPAINDAAFPDMDLNKLVYWTSTKSGSPTAFVVDFERGGSHNYGGGPLGRHLFHTRRHAVRLVRSGP